MRNFLENRPVIAPNQPAAGQPADSPLAKHSHLVTPASNQEYPKIELKYDADGKVKEIVVTCHCGERIVLQCAY